METTSWGALWIEYQTLASKYNNQMSTIKDWFEMQIKEQEYNNSQRNQQMQEMWFMMNLMNNKMRELGTNLYITQISTSNQQDKAAEKR